MPTETVSTLGDYLVGAIVLVIFLIGAAALITRKLPALITLPLMALGIVGGAAAVTNLLAGTSFYQGGVITLGDILNGVLPQGVLRLANPIIVAFLGGMLSFIMQKSGVAHSLVKQGAELIGDNPLAVALFSLGLIALLFTTIGGLGAVIMVALVVLPMLATVGVPPLVAGGIMLIGLSMGGIMNPQAWVLYTDTLRLPVETVRAYALTLFLLMTMTGIVFICVELMRAGVVRRIAHVAIALGLGLGLGAVLLASLVLTTGEVRSVLPVFSAQFAPHWQTHDTENRLATRFGESDIVFTIQPPFAGAHSLLSATAEQNWREFNDFRRLLPVDWSRYEDLSFVARSSAPAELHVRLVAEDGATTVTVPLLAESDTTIVIDRARLGDIDPTTITGVELSLAGPSESEDAPAQAATLALKDLRLKTIKATPLWKKVLRWIVGIALLGVVGIATVDLFRRVRTWRKQIVEIKWYAYLIPAVPLALIIVFDMDIIGAFVLGFAYAVLVTSRPGTVSMAIQSMIQGSAAVLPAVILMLGIGILLVSVLGPSGWSAANDGAAWPVMTAVQPLFKQIVPTNALGFVIVFSIFAPLALYRGPLNTWGLGFGVAAIMIATGNLTAGAIMAMLMTVGQIQGVCDPTNTHNVWLANELRVDVQGLMLKTLPYAWGMVVVGLVIASYRFF